MPKTAIKIGPRDHGQTIRLKDFEHAEVEEGYLYELSRGVITVSNVPKPKHMALVRAIKLQLYAYQLDHPDRIYDIASGSECKILIAALESERHPDLTVYTTPPPDDDDPWPLWIPDLVIEVVSPGFKSRDYREKPEEYLAFGIKKYWVVDADRREMLVHRRSRGEWVKKTVRSPAVYKTPLFPGLEFATESVFKAGK